MATILRVGLIGIGRWGKVYVKTLLSLGERCRLTHLGTSNPRNAALLPYPVKVIADWRALIRSDCDAIIIATPPHTHAEIVEACVGAGKPCIVEKPFCLDVATAERLHQLIQASNVPVLVDHTYLFHPAYLALKRALRDAQETIHVVLSEGMRLGPFRTGTPVIWEWCPHDFSLCLDLLGEHPEHVVALAGPPNPEGHAELVSVRLDFPGGACAWIQAGRLSPRKSRRLTVFTDRRLYVLDDLASEQLTVSPLDFRRRYSQNIPEPLEKTPIAPPVDRLPMANMVTYFLDGLAGGDRRYFGTELAVDIVRLLRRCEVTLKDKVRQSHDVVSRSTVRRGTSS